jgi:hypothetical protein
MRPAVPLADAVDEDPNRNATLGRRSQRLDELLPDRIGLENVRRQPHRSLRAGDGLEHGGKGVLAVLQ